MELRLIRARKEFLEKQSAWHSGTYYSSKKKEETKVREKAEENKTESDPRFKVFNKKPAIVEAAKKPANLTRVEEESEDKSSSETESSEE